MAKLDVFVKPQPWPALSRAMTWVNRVLMLHGVPVLRDIPFLCRIPGIRGLTDIRRIIVDPNDIAQLRALCESEAAVFILPNHPEFFTDWMIDKEIIARCCPNAASWATNGVVNGLGNAMQKFWLWNNLIAQIPGNSTAAKQHSIDWALQGNAVLLHPEGAVGWHSDYVAPLLPGAADMALEAKLREPLKRVFLAPVVWKLVFTQDATSGLSSECSYVEKKLKISNAGQGNPAQRVYAIYDQLLDRVLNMVEPNFDRKLPALEKRQLIERHIIASLTAFLGGVVGQSDAASLIKQVRKKARDEATVHNSDMHQAIKMADRLQRTLRLGDFAGQKPKITQEEVADHLKRLRNDFCKGSWRDTLNAFLPQPVARRNAEISMLEPVEILSSCDAKTVMGNLRKVLQGVLDAKCLELSKNSSRKAWDNPFFNK